MNSAGNMREFSLVVLSGGFGNQLFQLFAALNCSHDDELRVNISLVHDQVPILEIINQINSWRQKTNQKEISLVLSKLSFLQIKAHNFALRNSSAPIHKKHFKLMQDFISQSFCRIFFPNFKHYIVPNELGCAKRELPDVRNSLFIGYFQSKHWVKQELPQIKAVLDALEVKRNKKWNIDLAQSKSLLVHIRRGDYESDDRLGTLGKGYFIKAIDLAWNRGRYDEMHIYSNSNEYPNDCIPQSLQEYSRNMESQLNDSLDLLLQMRLSRGAVISNSTLSWWAVQTSEMKPENIFAPQPWFRKIKDPEGIIEAGWNLISSNNKEGEARNDA